MLLLSRCKALWLATKHQSSMAYFTNLTLKSSYSHCRSSLRSPSAIPEQSVSGELIYAWSSEGCVVLRVIIKWIVKWPNSFTELG